MADVALVSSFEELVYTKYGAYGTDLHSVFTLIQIKAKLFSLVTTLEK